MDHGHGFHGEFLEFRNCFTVLNIPIIEYLVKVLVEKQPVDVQILVFLKQYYIIIIFELIFGNFQHFTAWIGLDWNALFRVNKIVEKKYIIQVLAHVNRYV